MQRKLVSALLIVLCLPACAETGTLLPGSIKLLDDMPKIQNSVKSPCWQQQQIAAQNSYIATIRDKKEIVFKAPCDVDKLKQKVASK